jgi:CheY-like chemotaxis protein
MSPSDASAGAPPSVTVLLVEDDEVIRKSVSMALERYGYQVIGAGDRLEDRPAGGRGVRCAIALTVGLLVHRSTYERSMDTDAAQAYSALQTRTRLRPRKHGVSADRRSQ